MKILILADHFAIGGGAGKIAEEMALALAADHEVTVLAAHAPMPYVPKNFQIFIHDLDYPLKWRNFRGLWNSKAVRILRQHLVESTPDRVYIHNLHSYWSYSCLKVFREFRVPAVLTFHDVSVFTPYTKLCRVKPGEYRYPWYRHWRAAKWTYNPLRNFLIRKYLGFAGKTVSVSEELALALRQNQIRVDAVIYNGLQTRLNQIEAGKSGGDIIFLAGRLSTSKGVFQAVEYLQILKDRFHLRPSLWIAGYEGLVTEKMKIYAQHLGVLNQLNFLGYDVENYESNLSQSSVVIVPSICFDSFPTVILEAMRAQKPVVATNLGGAKEMIGDGITGFVVDPFDTEKFAEKIARILADRALARQMGEAGFARWKKNFTIEQMVKKYLNLLE